MRRTPIRCGWIFEVPASFPFALSRRLHLHCSCWHANLSVAARGTQVVTSCVVLGVTATAITATTPTMALPQVTTFEEVDDVWRKAKSNRTTFSNNVNEHSSRSHLVLSLYCKVMLSSFLPFLRLQSQARRSAPTRESAYRMLGCTLSASDGVIGWQGRTVSGTSTTFGKLHLIDLAGRLRTMSDSERLRRRVLCMALMTRRHQVRSGCHERTRRAIGSRKLRTSISRSRRLATSFRFVDLRLVLRVSVQRRTVRGRR